MTAPAGNEAALLESLAQGLTGLGQSLDLQSLKAMIGYLRLLDHWNHSFNLTAVRDVADMVALHLLDSLAIRPWLVGDRVLDVGAGAGLPGIPLAIAEPGKQFVLIDSAAKRCRFLTQAVLSLRLGNIRVENRRVEDYRLSPDDQPGFTTITARAFSSLDKLTDAAGHLLARQGKLLAMKGRLPENEIRTLSREWRIDVAERLQIPGVDAERHLLIIGRT